MSSSPSPNSNPNSNNQWRFTWETLTHVPTLRLYLFNPDTNPSARCRDVKASLQPSQRSLLVTWTEGDGGGDSSVRVPVPRVLIDPDGSVDVKARDDHIEVKLVLVLPVDHPIVLDLRGVLGSGEVRDRLAPLSLGSGVAVMRPQANPDDQPYTVARAGAAVYDEKNWTAAQHTEAIEGMRRGFMPDGTPVAEGPLTFHGQVLTIKRRVQEPIVRSEAPQPSHHEASGDNVDVEEESSRAHVLKFRKGSMGRILPEDTHTKRDKNGRTIPIKADDILAPNPAFANITSSDGHLLESAVKAATAKLIAKLSEINGQDAYSNETQAIGRLHAQDFLVLPRDLPTPVIPADLVGSGLAVDQFTPLYVIAVYALNKAAHKADTEAEKIKFATLRMEAVKCGWYENQNEVRFAPAPGDMLTVFEADEQAISDCLEDAALAAWLIPMISEHVFRTTGHHYLSGQGLEYNKKYEQVLKACLAPNLMSYLPFELLYHKALHWVSPARSYEVLKTNLHTDRVPEALRIRFNSAPAGTALVTTTMAVLESMQSLAIYNRLKQRGVADFSAIQNLVAKVKADPTKYHKVNAAYARAPLTEAERGEVEAAKKAAEKIAPITKAFIDSKLRESALFRQKVLDKYSNLQPVVYGLCRKLFNRVARHKVETVDDLFQLVVDTMAVGQASGSM